MLEIPAIKVNQWLPEWEEVDFGSTHRSRPDPHFYLFSMTATDLKRLTGIHRREPWERRLGDVELGIQRSHERDRSKLIARFVKSGYPWSALSPTQRSSGGFDDLKMPGWLPTAVVVNILNPSRPDSSEGTVNRKDAVTIEEDDNGSTIIALPGDFGDDWRPEGRHPIEVIDGQHRLWAFEEGSEDGFQLPVVAFDGLDTTWKAYLFWTINVTPKRINASLAYDLYPLLRHQGWLQRFAGHLVYRETRAQELVHTLYAHPLSPWAGRINLVGERGVPWVRQAAWIRSLMAAFVKRSEGRRVVIGGLFGADNFDRPLLPWSLARQAAFLMLCGSLMREAVAGAEEDWAESLRGTEDELEEQEFELSYGDSGEEDGNGPEDWEDEEPGLVEFDPAFFGRHTLLNTDQGIRGFLHVVKRPMFLAFRKP